MEKPSYRGSAAVLVVDMLKDFFKGGSSTLPSVAPERGLESNIRVLVDTAHRLHVPVIYVNDNWKNPGETEIDPEFRVWGPHAIDGTEGAQVVEGIEPTRPIDFIVHKHRYSGFFNTNLDTILRELGVKTCIFSGVHTNCCVQHTVMDAFFRAYETVLVSDCCAAPTKEEHQQGIGYMKTYYGSKIIELKEALNLLAMRASPILATEEGR